MKPVITAADLAGVPQGGELAVAEGAIVTPLARDEAERRGISFRVVFTASSISSNADHAKPPNANGADRLKKIAIGADHGGFELKETLKRHLSDWGYTIVDVGTHSAESVDYPDFAEAVARAVTSGEACLGIILDSAGIGSSIAANKVPGARAALCYDRATARNSREHNDANILSLGAKLLAPEDAREIVAVWLATPFAGGRHQRRIDKIRAIEERECAGAAERNQAIPEGNS